MDTRQVVLMLVAQALPAAALEPTAHGIPAVRPVMPPRNVSARRAEVTPRIIGGTEATPFEFPFLVLMLRVSSTTGNLVPNCGGSLIAMRWVLTAAHCVYNGGERSAGLFTASDVYVVVNAHDRTTYQIAPESALAAQEDGCSQVIQVSEIHAHPDWETDLTLPNPDDVALVYLSEDVRCWYTQNRFALLDGAAFSALPSSDLTAMTVAGWGEQQASGAGNKPDEVRKVTIPERDPSVCVAADAENPDEGFFFTVEKEICAGAIGESACQGDSGGALFVGPGSPSPDGQSVTQVGVVSYGYDCGNPSPGVFARVSYYVPWIYSTIGDRNQGLMPRVTDFSEPSLSDGYIAGIVIGSVITADIVVAAVVAGVLALQAAPATQAEAKVPPVPIREPPVVEMVQPTEQI